MNVSYETALEWLCKIILVIKNKNYSALRDAGASFSLINKEIKDCRKVKLKDSILFSTITEDLINYEVWTVALEEY